MQRRAVIFALLATGCLILLPAQHGSAGTALPPSAYFQDPSKEVILKKASGEEIRRTCALGPGSQRTETRPERSNLLFTKTDGSLWTRDPVLGMEWELIPADYSKKPDQYEIVVIELPSGVKLTGALEARVGSDMKNPFGKSYFVEGLGSVAEWSRGSGWDEYLVRVEEKK